MTASDKITEVLQGVRELADKATEGPWAVSEDDPGDIAIFGPKEDWLMSVGNWARQNPDASPESMAQQCVELRDADDAAFIAASRDMIPRLVAALEHQQATVAAILSGDWMVHFRSLWKYLESRQSELAAILEAKP